jgi:hypothetical protein
MNKRLQKAIAEVEALPEDRQDIAAEVLLDFVHQERDGISLTPEQLAEIDRRMASDGPYATDGEVRETFARLMK